MRYAVAAALALSSVYGQEKVDLAVIQQIKAEAFENSKVMDHLSYLTDWYGPRLTGSPEFKEAADWTVKRLGEYGLLNPHLEKWGPFGRSWSATKYSVELLAPRYALLAASPLAWSRPTEGTVTGDVILAPLSTSNSRYNADKLEADIETFKSKYKGKLRGKIVLLSQPKADVTGPEAKPELVRYTNTELTEMAAAPMPRPKTEYDPAHIIVPEGPEAALRFIIGLPLSELIKLFEHLEEIQGKLNQFLADEGVVAVLRNDDRAHDGLTFSEGAASYKATAKLAPPTFVVTAEHYNRLARLIEKKAPVKLAANLQAKISDGPVDAFNIVAEIPGTTKSEEVVMVGAHFDSWHSGTGATDNASGSAVMIEVMRILKTLNLKMDRTVRIGFVERGRAGAARFQGLREGALSPIPKP